MEVWELKLYFYPSAGGLKKRKLLTLFPAASHVGDSSKHRLIYCWVCKLRRRVDVAFPAVSPLRDHSKHGVRVIYFPVGWGWSRPPSFSHITCTAGGVDIFEHRLFMGTGGMASCRCGAAAVPVLHPGSSF